jgi:hypothetical protein
MTDVFKRKGTKFVPIAKKAGKIVSMIRHNERIFVAAENGVFILFDEKFTPLEIKKGPFEE